MSNEWRYWVVIATACSSCGGKSAVMVLDREPTAEDVKAAKDKLGGMYCIATIKLHLSLGKIGVTDEDDRCY